MPDVKDTDDESRIPHSRRWRHRTLRLRNRHGAQSLRNAGLTYRPVGERGEPYPDWVRALDGKSGVYVIREVADDGSSEVVYVGESHSDRLYNTLTRHFQTVRHEAQEVPMT